MLRVKRATVMFVLIGMLIFPTWSFASAPQAPGSFTFAPVSTNDPSVTEKGYFVYRLEPGVSASGMVKLFNPTLASITVQLGPVDATTAQRGGSAFSAGDPTQMQSAKWLTVDQSTVTLTPGEERKVAFEVRLPDTFQPGQYLAGLAASMPKITSQQAAPIIGKQANASIDLQQRYIIAVQLDVGSNWNTELTIPNVALYQQPSGSYLGIDIHNSGATFLKPTGSVVLKDHQGNVLLSNDLSIGNFLPGTAITYPIDWPGIPLPGVYQVAVNLTYGSGERAEYNGTIEVSAQQAEESPEAQHAAQNLVHAPSAIQPWMIYTLGAFFLLMCLLLGLNLLRLRASRTNV